MFLERLALSSRIARGSLLKTVLTTNAQSAIEVVAVLIVVIEPSNVVNVRGNTFVSVTTGPAFVTAPSQTTVKPIAPSKHGRKIFIAQIVLGIYVP